MKQFLVIYSATAEAQAQTKEMSMEDMKKGMDAWFAWKDQLGDAMVDFGSPLAPGLDITPDGVSPSKKNAIGYSIIQAEDMSAAQKLLEGHPHLGWADGCTITAFECQPLPKG